MDLGLVYRKTIAGDDALRERSRLRRSRLRAVLILVDGQSSAGELCRKLGAGFRPKATLSQLERLGFIEPTTVLPPPDPIPEAPLPEEAGMPAAAAQSAAEGAGEIVLAEPDFDQIPELPTVELQDAADAAEQTPPPESNPVESPAAVAPPDPPTAQETVPDTAAPEFPVEPLDETDEFLPPVEIAPCAAEPVAAPTAEPSREVGPETESIEDWPDSLLPQPTVSRPKPRRATRRVRFQERWSTLRGGLEDAFERRPRLPSLRLRLSRRLGLLFLLLAVLLAGGLAATLVPFKRYRVALEQAASDAIGHPVLVDSIGLTMTPTPGLELRDVTLGSPPILHVPIVRLVPNAGTLFGNQQLRVSLRAEGFQVGDKALVALCSGPPGRPMRTGEIAIDRIEFASVSANLGVLSLSGIQGEARLGETTRSVSVRTDDDAVKADLFAGERGCRVELSAHGLRLPYRSGLAIAVLEALGTLTTTGFEVSRLEARLQDGLLRGSGALDWAGRLRLALRLDLQHVELSRILPALGIDVVAKGRLDGSLQFAAEAPDPTQLAEAIGGRGSVVVTRGSLERFDLAEALRSGGATQARGGSTRFDELRAQIQFQPGNASLRDIRLNGGALSAWGAVRVAGRDQLSGELVAQLRSPGAARRASLTVGGTLAAPRLIPGDG